MKKVITLLFVAMGLSLLGGGSQADHSTHPEVVRAIREHAVALKKDAAAYQRKRVNAHLSHIIEDAKTLRRAMASHSCLKADTDAIQKAVNDLRSASLEADAQKASSAVNRLSNLTDGVLKKYCKEDTASHE